MRPPLLFLPLLAIACGGENATPPTTEADADYTSATAATLGEIEDPSSFVLTTDAIYATTSEGVVQTDLDGKNAKVFADDPSRATYLVAAEDDRLLCVARDRSIGALSLGTAQYEKLATMPRDAVAMTAAGGQLFYTWGWYNRGAGLDVLAFDGTPAKTIDSIGGPQGGESPVIVDNTIFVVDGGAWQDDHEDSTIIAFRPNASGGWSERHVAWVPETDGGALARGGSLVAHGDWLYLVGSRGLHRARTTDAAPTGWAGSKPYAELVVPSTECKALRRFAVDDDGIHLACAQASGLVVMRSFAFDGTPKKKLGSLRKGQGPFPAVIASVKTTADAVYVLQSNEDGSYGDSHLYRYAK